MFSSNFLTTSTVKLVRDRVLFEFVGDAPEQRDDLLVDGSPVRDHDDVSGHPLLDRVLLAFEHEPLNHERLSRPLLLLGTPH
jgi:hypothetical protein